MKKANLGLALVAALCVGSVAPARPMTDRTARRPAIAGSRSLVSREGCGSKYDPKHDPAEIAKQQPQSRHGRAQQETRGLLQENWELDLRRHEDPERMMDPVI